MCLCVFVLIKIIIVCVCVNILNYKLMTTSIFTTHYVSVLHNYMRDSRRLTMATDVFCTACLAS